MLGDFIEFLHDILVSKDQVQVQGNPELGRGPCLREKSSENGAHGRTIV